jgi:hypothetical protein
VPSVHCWCGGGLAVAHQWLNHRDAGSRYRRFRVRAHPQNPRKEVIQPQLPLQLPCYDFVPVTGPALDGCVLAVHPPASGVTSSHDVTGGVYKARERIHRSMADLRLLATPASCRRVAACNPNYERLWGIGSISRLGNPLYRPL